MAYKTYHGSCSPGVLRLVLVLVGVLLIGSIMNWLFTDDISSQASCPCFCDCSSESIFLTSLGFTNISLEDCGRHDPDVNEEMEKTVTDLLAEEVRLRVIVNDDNEKRAEVSILEAKKTSSRYQKESEKCNEGMVTCEEARQKAEASLRAELKLSELWEKRARARGWTDGNAVTPEIGRDTGKPSTFRRTDGNAVTPEIGKLKEENAVTPEIGRDAGKPSTSRRTDGNAVTPEIEKLKEEQTPTSENEG
ncbi:uncharacterized protein LOC143852212 [Tasmannia lanceolata]|uniref:uncharacterized protein LOC143852212 n=1 Tax=Tasmannia lanceolata TaxID=3420 RepID=UPI00406429B2